MGVAGSSGEMGAVGALATNLSSNIGHNIGALDSSRQISRHNQRAADYQSAASQNMANASLWGQVSSFGGSMFSAAGGANSLFGGGQTVTDVSGKTHTGVRWSESYKL